MASQVNVNALTVVHAGSDGVAPAFPDVCLTPSPARPPIPAPYPNLAQSADTAQGTKSLIVEGNPLMVQDAVFATSTGDEAGSVGGVASGPWVFMLFHGDQVSEPLNVTLAKTDS